MKRIIALLWLLPLWLQAADYAPISVDMQLQRLTDDVYYVQGKAGMATENQGFISICSR